MTENRENWLYPEASGLYFPHDGFIMRASDGKQYDYEEECELLNEYDKKYTEYRNEVLRLEKENEQLKFEKKEMRLLIDELYLFRLVYNALIFNNWYKYDEAEVYKSKKHFDGSIPFEDDEFDWFIVVAILPTGKQVTNHYPLRYWDYFHIPSYDKVKDEFDGHTSKEVWERLAEVV